MDYKIIINKDVLKHLTLYIFFMD